MDNITKKDLVELYSKISPLNRKPIIVLYYDVRGLNREEEHKAINRTYNSINKGSFLEEWHLFIIPHHSDHKMECINPVLLTENEYELLKAKEENVKLKLFNNLKNK